MLAQAGMPLAALPSGQYPLQQMMGGQGGGLSLPKFAQVDNGPKPKVA
jgi:hypothetical protein